MAEPKKPAAPAPAESIEEMKKRFAPKKKSLALTAEMMSGMQSYEDKVVLVKLLTEKEQSRVVQMVKNMLKSK